MILWVELMLDAKLRGAPRCWELGVETMLQAVVVAYLAARMSTFVSCPIVQARPP